MKQTTGKIIKSDQINIEGTYQIGLSQSNQCTHESLNTTLRKPEVKIIENNDGYVVIQVTCSCGQKINLKGEYNALSKS